MSDMRCGNCGQLGIRWMGPLSNLTHTECPHCGGTNCQEADLPEPHFDEEGCIECDWGEQPCHCGYADEARASAEPGEGL